MLFRTAKIHTFRHWGLLLILGGMAFMVAGTAALVFDMPGARIIAALGLIVGLLTMSGSMVVYFVAGVFSTNAVQIVCPACGKATKILGRNDRCMHCHTRLSLDPEGPKKPL